MSAVDVLCANCTAEAGRDGLCDVCRAEVGAVDVLAGGDCSIPMPTFEAVKGFLREYYLHSRFEGRDGPVWGRDYSGVVTRSALDDLELRGISCVSMYESNRGRVIWFDRSLTVLNSDEAPAQIQRRAGNLTHICGGGW